MTEQAKQIDHIKPDDALQSSLEQQLQDDVVTEVAFSLTHDKFFKWVFARPQLGTSFLKQVLDQRLQKQLILEYVMLLHAEEAKIFKEWKRNSRLSPIIPVILHHGKSRFKGETQLTKVIRKLPGADQYQLQMEAILFDLFALEQDELPVDPTCPELWPVLAAMKNVFRKETGISTFKEIMDILKSYIDDDSYYIDLARHFVHYFGTYFKSLTDEEIQDIDATIEKTLGGNNMPEFQNSYYRAGKANAEPTWRAKERSENIVKVLNHRFEKVPYQLTESLLMIDDLDKLEVLFDFALNCQTLEEFQMME